MPGSNCPFPTLTLAGAAVAALRWHAVFATLYDEPGAPQ